MPGYTWKAGLKHTKIELEFTKDRKLFLLLENNIRGGIFSVMGYIKLKTLTTKHYYTLMPIIYTDGL